jgi:hypothetical protein
MSFFNTFNTFSPFCHSNIIINPTITSAILKTATSNSVQISDIYGKFTSLNVIRTDLINNTVYSFIVNNTTNGMTYTDISVSQNRLYSYQLQPIISGVYGVVYIISGKIGTLVNNYNLIDTSGLVMNYGFDFIMSTLPVSYNIQCLSIIDKSRMIMYYDFETTTESNPVLGYGTVSCSTSTISVSFNYEPTVYYLSVARLVNGTPVGQYNPLPPGVFQYTDPSSIFYPINVYSYSFIPYNGSGVQGSPYTTVAVSPPPSISSGSFSSNSSNISFNLLTSTSFYSATIQRLLNGTPIETYQSIPYGTTVYVDPSNVFLSDVSYSYTMIPYNVLGVSGTAYTTSFVSPLPYVITGPLSYNNSDISFALFGDFNTVAVARIVNGIPIESYQSMPYGTTIYIDPSHVFNAMSTYSYSILPYNKSGVAGVSYTTMPISMYPSINMGSVGNICVNNNDISFALLSAPTYNTISIARLVNGQMIEPYQSVPSVPNGITIYIDPSNVFYSSNSYSYSIIPYNVVGQPGTAFITTSVSPYPSITVGLPTATYQQITVDLNGYPSFYQIAVQRLVNQTPIESFKLLSPTFTTLYTDPSSSFLHDISYSYAIIPYNAVGQAGNKMTTTTIQYIVNYLLESTAPIDSYGLQMFYTFNYVAYSVPNSTSYSSIIDTSGILFYYRFDF